MTARDLLELRDSAGDQETDGRWQAAEDIRRHFAKARSRRSPMFITEDELRRLAHCPLAERFLTDDEDLGGNSADAIERVTAHALSFVLPDEPALEFDVRVQSLLALPGVHLGLASVVLSVCDPEHYAHIDFDCWCALFGDDPDEIDPEDYGPYLWRLRELTVECQALDTERQWDLQLVTHFASLYCSEQPSDSSGEGLDDGDRSPSSLDEDDDDLRLDFLAEAEAEAAAKAQAETAALAEAAAKAEAEAAARAEAEAAAKAEAEAAAKAESEAAAKAEAVARAQAEAAARAQAEAAARAEAEAAARAEAEAAEKARRQAETRRRQEEARKKFEEKKRLVEPISPGIPEFAQEAKRVADTVELAGVARRALADWGDAGADRWAGWNLAAGAREREAECRKVEEECHFARMDVRDANGGVRTHYIGHQGFHYQGLDVVDWRAPVAGLYYQGDGPHVSYNCPKGRVNAFLLLKRDLVVNGTDLESMTDLVDRRQARE
jgi:hypothetical protein